MNSSDKASMIAFCTLFVCLMMTVCIVVACNTVFDSEADQIKQRCLDLGYAEMVNNERTRLKEWKLIAPEK